MSEICPITITVQLLFTLRTLRLPKPKVQPHLRANVGKQIKDGGAITCPVRESPFEPSLMPLKRGEIKEPQQVYHLSNTTHTPLEPSLCDRGKNNCGKHAHARAHTKHASTKELHHWVHARHYFFSLTINPKGSRG